MLPRVIPLSLVALFLAGCGRPSQSSPAAPEATQVADGAGRIDSNARAASPSEAPDARSEASGVDLAASLAELTQALRKYSFEHQRLPKTVAEVVAAGYAKNIPPAPAGKKFAIDAKTVQVIVVKQ